MAARNRKAATLVVVTTAPSSLRSERQPLVEARWHPPGGGRLLPIPDLFFKAFGARLRKDDPRFAVLRNALLDTDPVGDAVAALFGRLGPGEGRALLDRALDHGIASLGPDAPQALVTLFAEVDHVPSWLDRDAMRLATNTMLRFGSSGTYALGSASLMSGYLSRGAVKPLVATGALTRMARRRLSETGKYVRDLATSGDLGRFSDGVKTTVRVRVMHSLVRRRLIGSPTWRRDEWGAPINQRDMVGTHLEFTVAYIGGLAAMGFTIGKRERAALMHMWRYLGLLMGIRVDLVPKTFAEALELAWIFNQTEAGPDEDSRALAAALMTAWSEGLPGRRGGMAGKLEGRFLSGFARFILGREASDALGLPNDVFKYAVLAVAPLRMTSELARRVVPGGTARAIRRGRAVIESELAAGLEGRAPSYEPEP